MRDFPIQNLIADDASKTEIAQKLADWMISNDVVIPVYEDRQKKHRTYYQYIDRFGYWLQVDEDAVLTIAKAKTGKQWTKHLKREFLNQIRHHENHMEQDDFGLDDNEILCRYGKVFDLETGRTRPIRKNDYAVNRIEVNPHKFGRIEEFKELLRDTLPNEEHRKTFQEFVGWTLKYPDGDYEKLLLILGDTDSGKSTILKIIRALFEHCETTSISLTQIGQERAFHVNELKGSVLNIDEDMSSAKIEQSSMLKKVVSQEETYVEPKNEKGFEMVPRCKIMVASNVAPNPETEKDRAFYNRFLTLEAPERVPKEEQDKTLVDRLTQPESLNGIFHWALKGLSRLEEQGSFTHSPDIMETRRLWNKYGSEVHRFVYECVSKNEGHHVRTVDAYELYELWSMDRIGDTMSKQEFIKQMSDMPNMIKARISTDSGGRNSVFKHIEIDIE